MHTHVEAWRLCQKHLTQLTISTSGRAYWAICSINPAVMALGLQPRRYRRVDHRYWLPGQKQERDLMTVAWPVAWFMSSYISAYWNSIYEQVILTYGFCIPQMPSLDPKPVERNLDVVLWSRQFLRLHIRLKGNGMEYATGRTGISFGFQLCSFVLRTTRITSNVQHVCMYLSSAEGLVGSNASAMCFLAN